MTGITELRETLDTSILPDDLSWVSSATPAVTSSLYRPGLLDIGDILTSTLFVTCNHVGHRWLVATDMYRLHALSLPRDGEGPSTGSYKLTDGRWTRAPAELDASRFEQWLHAPEVQPPAWLEFTPPTVAAILAIAGHHPNMLMVFDGASTVCFPSIDDMTNREVLACNPLRGDQAPVGLQLRVIRPALESGITEFRATGDLTFRGLSQDRMAAIIGVHPNAWRHTVNPTR